jgi:hypothetical protein
VAEIGQPQAVAGEVGQGVLARPQHLAGRARHEPRDQPQQRRLAGPVAPDEHQRTPRLQPKGKIGEDEMVSSEGCHAPDLKHA